MRSPLDVLWDWDYLIEHKRLEDLYAKAKREQWNADVEIDWARPVDPGGKILDSERMAILRLAFFQRFDKKQLEVLNAHYSAWILSQLLHGEQGALMVAGELVAAVPDLEAKLYCASQAMDEARHVEVFRRYIDKLDRIYPAQPVLAEVLHAIFTTPHWPAKMVGMQVILEGLALGTFINVRASTGCDLLRELLTYVTKDEARHVAFGNIYLADAIAAMHPDDRAEVEDFALDVTRKIVAMRRGMEGFAGFDDVLRDSQIDPDDFLNALRAEVAGGFQLSSTPGSVHTFKGIIMPGVVRAGLVSERVRPRYEEAGIRVFRDQRVLESLESA
jgi:para-aminobenzoate N-oxygenase AurF